MAINSSSAVTLFWDFESHSSATFTVWYSTDSHDSDPSTPPQGALVVSGLNSTSVTITLPDTDNSCKPYYVWISVITPNGQQSPYSKRRQVEVCRMLVCASEHIDLIMFSNHLYNSPSTVSLWLHGEMQLAMGRVPVLFPLAGSCLKCGTHIIYA